MSRTQFSEATLQLRREAEAALDALLRAVHKDRFESGVQDPEEYEDYPEFITLEGAHLTGWIVAAQYQTLEDMESMAVIHTGSASPVTVKSGLAKYADCYWS